MNRDDEYHSGRGGRESVYPLLGDQAERPPNLPEDFTRPHQPVPAGGLGLPT